MSLSSSGLPLGPPGRMAVVRLLCWFLVLACGGRFSDPVFLSHLTVTYICAHLFNMQQIRNVCNLSGAWGMLAKTSNKHKCVKTICLDQVEAALELIVGQSCDSYPVCRWDHISYKRRTDLSQILRSDWSGFRVWVPLLPDQCCLLLEDSLGMRTSSLMVQAPKLGSGW